MALTDLYKALFGKEHIKDGDVISMSEHGRVGGVSTGEGYKKVGILDVPPTDQSKLNPSLSLSNVDSVVASTKILTKTIGVTSYERKLSFNAAGDFISASVWTQV